MNMLSYLAGWRLFLASGLVIMVPLYVQAKSKYKSAGERIVAEGLRQLGLSFAYEYPWAVEVHGKPRIFYPDFTLKDYGVIIEYMGMQGNLDYERIMARKERLYREAAVPVIVLHPEDLHDGWQASLLERIQEICQHRSSLLERSAERGMASMYCQSIRRGSG